MAGGSAQTDTSPSAKMMEFCSLPPAWPRIALLVTAFLALVMLAAQGNVEPLPSLGIRNDHPTADMWERLTFLTYAALFVSMWLVYFFSRSEVAFFRVRTLRKLLQLTSQHWMGGVEEIEKIYTDKARTSITVLGILTAAAGLELVQVNAILLSATQATFVHDPWKDSPWKAGVLGLATLAAIAAFVLFLVSADSLDSIFNKFDAKADDDRLKHHFYKQTITPRYLGMVMLMSGAILLVAFHEPALASTGMGVLIAVGYRYWFPNFPAVCADVQPDTVTRFLSVIERVGGIAMYLLLVTCPFLTSRLGTTPIPSYFFAALAALLWAFSAPIINRGLNQLPAEKSVHGLTCGLLVSLVSGSVTLTLLTLGAPGSRIFSLYLVIAGVLTFPVATGLYYGCARAFGGRAEFAAQFVKVKPIFSVFLAVAVLRESFKFSSGISLLLIAIGVYFLWSIGQQGKSSFYAIGLGLLTALSWSLGEILFKLGHHSSMSLDDTLLALLSGTVIGGIATLLTTVFVKHAVRVATCKAFRKWIIYFVLHGVLSFGLAYACFFKSIAVLGVSRTVMITAFWPIASIVTSAKFVFDQAAPQPVSWRAIVAAAALLAGALLQILT